MGATASLEPAAVRVDCGATAEVVVTVRNTGQLVDEMLIDVLGEAAPWTVVEPPILRLFPGAEGTATVRFSPPRDSRTPYGRLPFGVRVVPREDPAHLTVEEGQVEVAPFVELAAEILPRTSKSWRRASHRIAVDNRGNAAVPITLIGADPDAALDVAVTPSTFLAAPGSATLGRARVTAGDRLWRGAPVTMPFTVMVQPDGTGVPGLPDGAVQLVKLDASFAQQPIIPPTLPRTLATVAALILAAIVAWTLVLRPTVEKTASQAVEEPLQRADQNIKTVADKVGVQVPSITGSETAAPSASESAAAADNPLLGTPVTFTLQVERQPGENANEALTDAEVVPLKDGDALTVTSVNVQNPFRDLGLITVFRQEEPETAPEDEEVLLKASLADVTTQTTTFDPPVVLEPDTTVAVAVQCTTPGGLPNGQDDEDGNPVLVQQGENTCKTTVVITGYTRSSAASASPTPRPTNT